MASSPSVATLSTRGQIILPKAVRDRKRWQSGTRLIVEERPEGVLLRQEPLFKPTRPEDVFGSASYRGPAKTIREMDESVLEEAKRQIK